MKFTLKTFAIFSLAIACTVIAGAAKAERGRFSFDSVIVDAVENDQKKVVEMLLNDGANPDEKGKFETTPLHRAAFNGSSEIVSVLLSKGANANIKDFGGATPLHMAARKGNIEVVRKLIENQADINSQDNEGFTPLQRAIANENTAVAVFLLEAGAQIDSVDTAGNTPLIEAVRKNNATIIEELLVQGADRDRKNNVGYSATDYAAKNDNKDVIDVLSKSVSDIKRQRAIKGNSVIVVSKSQIDRNDLPAYLHNRVSWDKAPEGADSARIDLTEVRVLRDNELPWLNERNYQSQVDSVTVRPLNLFDAGGIDEVYDELTVKPNMPVVNTSRVTVEDSVSESEIYDILSLDNSDRTEVSELSVFDDVNKDLNSLDKNRLSVKDDNNFFVTRPVDSLQVVREKELARKETNVIDLGSSRKDYTSSGSSDLSFNDIGGSASYKLAKNEIDYSGYDIASLPASLRLKYILSLSPDERRSLYRKNPETSDYAASNVKVKQVNLGKNNFIGFKDSGEYVASDSMYRTMPVASIQKVSDQPLEPIMVSDNLAGRKLPNEDLLDRQFNEFLDSSSQDKFNPNARLPKVDSDNNYSRRDLINNINSFYNNKSAVDEGYEVLDITSEALPARRDTRPSLELGSDFASSPTSMDNLPKSQVYKKLLADKANQKLPDNVSYSDVNFVETKAAALISGDVIKTQKTGFSEGLSAPNEYLSNRFDNGPASMSSATKTDSLLAWDGFSNDDLDRMYNEAVLGIPSTKSVKTAVIPVEAEPIMVDSFPNDGVIEPVYKSDMMVSPKVNSVPVQITDMDTLKPKTPNEPIADVVSEDTMPDLSMFETKIDMNKPLPSTPEPAPKIEAPKLEDDGLMPYVEAVAEKNDADVINVEDTPEEAAQPAVIYTNYKDDDSLNGNHSIIGAFASTDDAVSYFNSISSRLGFAYNHKILKSKEDGKYYIAIGSLSDDSVAEKLCKAYASDYVACVRSRSASEATGFDVLKVKKVYSLLGEFGSAEDAKLYFSKKIASKNVNYKVAKAGSSDIYLLQLGPLSDGIEAKKLCKDVASIDQKCKITVK